MIIHRIATVDFNYEISDGYQVSEITRTILKESESIRGSRFHWFMASNHISNENCIAKL